MIRGLTARPCSLPRSCPLPRPPTRSPRRTCGPHRAASAPTLTLTDQQFLAGDKAGAKATTLGGELSIAQGTGRLPAVILMHGSGRAGGNIGLLAAPAAPNGHLEPSVIDGMTGARALPASRANQASLGRLNFIVDMYRALGRPRQAPAGRSRAHRADGLLARRARACSMRASSASTSSGTRAASSPPPMSPSTRTAPRPTATTRRRFAAKPIRIFHGTPEQLQSVAHLQELRRPRLKEAEADVELTEYPKAEHGFRQPARPEPGPGRDERPVWSANARSARARAARS
jgi:acetyl esterase/lipase